MLPTPVRYSLVSGAAEGRTPLTAFDQALLAAGIGNLNLLKVSSILPPGAVYAERLTIPPGSLLPVAYATMTSAVPGDLIAAAVAVGHGGLGEHGVIMETSGHFRQEEIEERIKAMVEEAFAARGLMLSRLEVAAVSHRVQHLGCVLAAVPLWY
ncbi:MAG: arginine decarboxylase, pyruvoyl-dependent [Bacillota bacterium]|nr:arginine decarboxylase, pyruvoyl-dependent [Bacillota bacterium]